MYVDGATLVPLKHVQHAIEVLSRYIFAFTHVIYILAHEQKLPPIM